MRSFLLTFTILLRISPHGFTFPDNARYMGKLIEFIARNQQPVVPDIAIIRHAEKHGINGDISAIGMRNALTKGLEYSERLQETSRSVHIDDANVNRISHTADAFEQMLEEHGIPVTRGQKPELSRDSIFINPSTSALRKRIYQQLSNKTESKNDGAMGALLLEWMDRGELGFGIADGTVSFPQAQRVHAFWLKQELETVREAYQKHEPAPVTLRFTHEIQAFILSTFGVKKDRRGRIVKTGADIVRERYGVTKNLTGPAFFYDAKNDTFTMQLPRFNKHGQIHSYEVFSVNEELIAQLAKHVTPIPEQVTTPAYDSSPSLLIRTMRRQVAMGFPVQPTISEEVQLAA